MPPEPNLDLHQSFGNSANTDPVNYVKYVQETEPYEQTWRHLGCCRSYVLHTNTPLNKQHVFTPNASNARRTVRVPWRCKLTHWAPIVHHLPVSMGDALTQLTGKAYFNAPLDPPGLTGLHSGHIKCLAHTNTASLKLICRKWDCLCLTDDSYVSCQLKHLCEMVGRN